MQYALLGGSMGIHWLDQSYVSGPRSAGISSKGGWWVENASGRVNRYQTLITGATSRILCGTLGRGDKAHLHMRLDRPSWGQFKRNNW